MMCLDFSVVEISLHQLFVVSVMWRVMESFWPQQTKKEWLGLLMLDTIILLSLNEFVLNFVHMIMLFLMLCGVMMIVQWLLLLVIKQRNYGMWNYSNARQHLEDIHAVSNQLILIL